MKAKTTLLVVMLVLLTIVVSAEETSVNLKEVEYKQIVIQENAKTQAYIKQELAKRDADMERKVYKYIDDNFLILDERIDGFIRKASFKLGMVFFSGLVLGGTILMLINKRIKRKRLGSKYLSPEQSKGEEKYTTLNDDTVTRMKAMRDGKEIKNDMEQELLNLKREWTDELHSKKANVNTYLQLGDSR